MTMPIQQQELHMARNKDKPSEIRNAQKCEEIYRQVVQALRL